MALIKQFKTTDTNELIFPKTNGEAVITKLPNNKILKLDAAWTEFAKYLANGFFPIGEERSFAVNDPNLDLLESLGQQWLPPEGQLLKVADYPELFALTGYMYGWGDSASFTGDKNDQGKVINEAGNQLIVRTVNADGSLTITHNSMASQHIYFRIPDGRGRFSRQAGDVTLMNRWKDSDGNSHSIQTRYYAELGDAELDAQRGISGSIYMRGTETLTDEIGALRDKGSISYTYSGHGTGSSQSKILGFDSSLNTPISNENAGFNNSKEAKLRVF